MATRGDVTGERGAGSPLIVILGIGETGGSGAGSGGNLNDRSIVPVRRARWLPVVSRRRGVGGLSRPSSEYVGDSGDRGDVGGGGEATTDARLAEAEVRGGGDFA